jgi:hypothetical protein
MGRSVLSRLLSTFSVVVFLSTVGLGAFPVSASAAGDPASSVGGSPPQGCPPPQGGPPPAYCPPPPPARTLPSAPFAYKICTGPYPDGSVAAGQSETCTIYASGGASYQLNDRLTIARTAPTASIFTVTSCAGTNGPGYQTFASPATTNNLCVYSVVSGSVFNGQVMGTETIAIATAAPAGTPIEQVAMFCAPGNPQPGSCSDLGVPIVVSGPGAIVKGTQTITFGPLPTRTFGDAPFAVGATASSGLPVTYTALGPCRVSGNIVTITGGGVCTIFASQPGNNTYVAALTVEQTLNIDCLPSTLPFAVAGPNASLVFANLTLADAHVGGGCGGSFAVQLPLPQPMQPLTVATGTFTALTSDSIAGAIAPTIAMGTLTGTALANPLFPFSATLKLDVATGLGSITTTMTTEGGPATVVVTFARVGPDYVITGATRT